MSLREAALDEFYCYDDNEQLVSFSLCRTTIATIAKECGLKPAKAKFWRILEYTSHHARSHKSVAKAVKARLKRDKNFLHDSAYGDEKGWKGEHK